MQDTTAASIRSGNKWRVAALRLGRRGIEASICAVLMMGPSLSAWAQDASPPAAPSAAAADSSADSNADASAPADYTMEQLDALLAPIALYPDQLLTQILMASAYPLDIVSAYRWAQEPANKALTGDALATALEAQSWDPSVKSLIPFPTVLSTMNDKLEWVQQLGYAMENQEGDVMNSVQRLRAQAQEAGQLQSNTQQTVSTEGQSIIIAPTNPTVVYVPSYNPTVVYGTWPYAAYPPVYLPPPPGYALASGIAFGVGVAVTASLWGWARPSWGYRGGYGNINVNVNRYNNINRNRTQIHNSNWRANRPAGANRPGRNRPPGGPVGRPGRGGGLPANAIGRPNVKVPGNITRPPGGMGGNRPGNGANRPGNGGANRPGNGGANRPGNGAGNRPGGGNGAGAGNRPGAGAGNRPGGGNGAGAGNRPGGKPGGGAGNKMPGKAPGGGMNKGNRPNGGGGKPGAFSGMNQGKSASQFGNRGAQSRAAGGARGGGGGGGAKRGGGGGGGGGRMGGGGGGRRK